MFRSALISLSRRVSPAVSLRPLHMAAVPLADARVGPVPVTRTGNRVTFIQGYEPVEPLGKAKSILEDLYGQILTALEQVPKEAGYRVLVEATTKDRLRIVQEGKTYEEIEEKIGTGLVEELIEQAQDELKLIPDIVAWKPWLIQAAPKEAAPKEIQQ